MDDILDKMIKTPEQLHEEDLQRIRGFRLLDDDFMTIFFNDNPEDTETLLRSVMNNSSLKVKKVETQKPIRNLTRRSLGLDIYAEDENDVKYDVEIQRSDVGADPRRARFHSSMIDVDSMRKGTEWEALPESYVIFITETDYYRAGKPIYHVNRYIEEIDEAFNDGEHIIYVNSEIQDDTELGRMMHDFHCISADQLYNKKLAERIRYFKESEEGVRTVCKVMEDMRKEAAEMAIWQSKVESVMKWVAKGIKLEDIAECEGLTLEEVKEIAGQRSA